MAFLDLVKKRRSVRRYTPTPVPKEAIVRCLEAARFAPSACHSQPWCFVVVDDQSLKEEVARAAFSGPYAMNRFAIEAPVLIVVVRDKSKTFARLGGLFRQVRYNLIDIGIAWEHFVLQAAEEGLGTCWLGWFDENAAKRILRIQKDKKADIMISMGYPADTEFKDKPRKSLEEISRFNHFWSPGWKKLWADGALTCSW
jgi:nitroreductase